MKHRTLTEEIRATQLSEQWIAYRTAKKAHDEYYAQRKPRRAEFDTEENYSRALNEWSMAWSCDGPNPPGYEYANNH